MNGLLVIFALVALKQLGLKFTLLISISLFCVIYSQPQEKSANIKINGKIEENTNEAKPRSSRKAKVIKNDKKIRKTEPVYTKTTVPSSSCNYIVFYSSLTGTSRRVAKQLQESLTNGKSVELFSLDDDLEDLDSYFLQTPQKENLVYLLVLPSYESDSPIDYFLEFLQETSNDFRVDKYPLKSLTGFAVLGLGDKEQYGPSVDGDNLFSGTNGREKSDGLFCYQAKLADRFLSKLGGRRVYPAGKVCVKTEMNKTGKNGVNDWINGFSKMLNDDEPFILDNEPFYDSDDEQQSAQESDGEDEESKLVDMEDLRDVENNSESNNITTTKKQMVAKDSPTYTSLTKQGYTVVGSHSGVKICRWTKSALRGRGFCYKYAFYGIRSHRCMETTPSLSCSNKCVFCWRHGTNPVGTTWRWEVDEPDVILKGALEGHYNKIKQMRGVPGVIAERFEEAFKVGHCALSLVGEPIFYPHINKFLDMLHEQDISSFLVCNAQHPDQLETLNKVTQLYVSIDAADKKSLKKVDRPLFRDYWERLERCLDILRTSQNHQRTVFRLTLVKGFNMDLEEVKGYADLVERGLPALIEIKGATFCGSSDGNGNPLTMQNIPFYEECKTFVEAVNDELNARGLEYGLAAEHAHSCCFLIASKKFYIEDKWYTHIDYEKFFKLWRSGEDFTLMDYIAETPEWSYYGSKQGGFSPDDTRFDRKADKERKRLEREANASNV